MYLISSFPLTEIHSCSNGSIHGAIMIDTGTTNRSIPYIRSIKATFINQSKEWWVSCNSENLIRPEKIGERAMQ